MGNSLQCALESVRAKRAGTAQSLVLPLLPMVHVDTFILPVHLAVIACGHLICAWLKSIFTSWTWTCAMPLRRGSRALMLTGADPLDYCFGAIFFPPHPACALM